ncbi:hypothetical protein FA95DRAFT_1494325 [Auriscalpium vulgare]|uniref:Uncharacterized protein n=1 Tax=Auriscalpium vulgare TaxID=40419 RepID=A0ACB8RPX1_9AGAM|nr:hypothetical protein FA95DRAFT_1494325 [Auriscalpium vulgare]
MPTVLENVGSAARDFCMLERNFLSHVRLGLLLLLLSCSVLLKVRIPGPDTVDSIEHNTLGTTLASVEVATAFVVIFAGLWEYESGFRDMRGRRAFLVFSAPHMIIMVFISAVIFTTCLVLLARGDEIGP